MALELKALLMATDDSQIATHPRHYLRKQWIFFATISCEHISGGFSHPSIGSKGKLYEIKFIPIKTMTINLLFIVKRTLLNECKVRENLVGTVVTFEYTPGEGRDWGDCGIHHLRRGECKRGTTATSFFNLHERTCFKFRLDVRFGPPQCHLWTLNSAILQGEILDTYSAMGLGICGFNGENFALVMRVRGWWSWTRFEYWIVVFRWGWRMDVTLTGVTRGSIVAWPIGSQCTPAHLLAVSQIDSIFLRCNKNYEYESSLNEASGTWPALWNPHTIQLICDDPLKSSNKDWQLMIELEKGSD